MFKKALATSAMLMLAGSAAHAQFIVYDNTTNFTTTGTANGGATAASPITTLIADDITFLPGYGGQTISQFSFEVANFDTATFTARPRVRFYDTTGTGGGPGNYIAGFTFVPVSFTGNQVNFVTGAAGAGSGFVIPANGKIWAGITFDNAASGTTTSSATVANLNNLGQEVYSPPTVGSSTSSFFQTTATGSFVQNAPAGTVYSGFTGGTPGNFAWQFQVAAAVAPEPSQYAAFGLGILGVGALALKARRRGVTA